MLLFFWFSGKQRRRLVDDEESIQKRSPEDIIESNDLLRSEYDPYESKLSIFIDQLRGESEIVSSFLSNGNILEEVECAHHQYNFDLSKVKDDPNNNDQVDREHTQGTSDCDWFWDYDALIRKLTVDDIDERVVVGSECPEVFYEGKVYNSYLRGNSLCGTECFSVAFLTDVSKEQPVADQGYLEKESSSEKKNSIHTKCQNGDALQSPNVQFNTSIIENEKIGITSHVEETVLSSPYTHDSITGLKESEEIESLASCRESSFEDVDLTTVEEKERDARDEGLVIGVKSASSLSPLYSLPEVIPDFIENRKLIGAMGNYRESLCDKKPTILQNLPAEQDIAMEMDYIRIAQDKLEEEKTKQKKLRENTKGNMETNY